MVADFSTRSRGSAPMCGVAGSASRANRDALMRSLQLPIGRGYCDMVEARKFYSLQIQYFQSLPAHK